MKRFVIILSCLLLGVSAAAQTSREELLSHMELTAGNYANYPLPTGHLTPAPKGYEPFYISHYGRHGSRYMTSDKHFRHLRKQLDSALTLGLLTEYGKAVRIRIMTAEADANKCAGLLTELGARQHKAIAKRMYDNYSGLLGQPLHVSAISSSSRRVIRSMENFCGELKELNPSLDIAMSASEADQQIHLQLQHRQQAHLLQPQKLIIKVLASKTQMQTRAALLQVQTQAVQAEDAQRRAPA